MELLLSFFPDGFSAWCLGGLNFVVSEMIFVR
jgi:hypothetical protein